MQGQISLTRISSKGQVVIPGEIRKKLKIQSGEYFAVTQKDGLLVFKRLQGQITAADLKTLERLKEAWDDFEHGRFKKGSLETLMKEMS